VPHDVAQLEADGAMKQIHFTVDSALLRELGERLVGKAHIAVAELVKNSYDADSTKVVVRFRPNRIEVFDNGHGMDFREFKDFWMRIGTPHKQEKRVSRKLKRPMTGSKGVGRLAVQFLASKLELRTVPEAKPRKELRAYVNWGDAVQAGELTEALADYEEIGAATQFPDGSRRGTAIILSELKQQWTSEDIVNLAREIWWLQPSFRSNPDLTSDRQRAFEVEVKSPDQEAVREFQTQMRAYLDIWHARLVGKLTEGSRAHEYKETRWVHLSLELSDRPQSKARYPIRKCRLSAAEFEIRVFHLKYRQRHGIKVSEAREYLNQYGGVHVYDTGFHLPFYGPDTDWLNIEMDHSHRLSRSQLLPEELQVSEGMTHLPTQSRLLGVVHVNTSKEREVARQRSRNGKEDYLKISVTRDRLVDNEAFGQLRDMVRWALDFYAMQEAKRSLEEAEARRAVEPVQEKFERVEEVLEKYREDIPKGAYETLRIQVQEAVAASETQAEVMARQVGILGPLATAGICALAYEHEVTKQFQLLEDVIRELGDIRASGSDTRGLLKGITGRLNEWMERARATRALFFPLMDVENRDKKARFKARELVEQVREQMGVLTRGIKIETRGIDDSLRLPEAGFAEWSAIFQNVFINAINAMLDAQTRRIGVRSRMEGRTRALLVQDTGCGVDLPSAEDLFRPFVRKLKLSPERRALGFGGSGLGLTIVRMIAENLNCKVAFVEPDAGFNTAFQLSWSEGK